MTNTFTERHHDVLSGVHRMFPRMSTQTPPSQSPNTAMPWGLRFATPVTASSDAHNDDAVSYDPHLQIGVMTDGSAACDMPSLMSKKGNTVEDGQTWSDEHPQ